MADLLASTAQALSFIGGVQQLIVPDNPKAMIAGANRYEPCRNDTVLDFARHYGTSILPARPRHPQDKAKAESAVKIVERWIIARLRHEQFGSEHVVNVAIAYFWQDSTISHSRSCPSVAQSPSAHALPAPPFYQRRKVVRLALALDAGCIEFAHHPLIGFFLG